MLVQSLITSDRYGIKCPYAMSAVGVCIHNTANDASAQNEVAYMKRNDNEVSFHIAVDDKEAIQAIPFDRNAWHAGDGGSGKGNRNYIALEICYSKSGGPRFAEAEKRAAKIAASILKQNGWGISQLKKHQDFSNKYCPHRTLDNGWDRFVNMVKAELNYSVSPSTPPGAIAIGSKVKVVGSTYATGQNIPSWVKNSQYTVQEINGDRALLKEITSWVYIKDLTLISGGTISTPTPMGTIAIGSKVKVIGSNYATGQAVPGWVKQNTYTVQEVSGNKALLKEIVSWVYIKDLTLISGGATTPGLYKVKIEADVLNVRSNPGVDYPVKTTVRRGEVYTIVDSSNGWGKLKSGAGWISLEYTTRI